MCTCVEMSAEATGVKFLGAGGTGNCEKSNVGAGSQAQVLSKSTACSYSVSHVSGPILVLNFTQLL